MTSSPPSSTNPVISDPLISLQNLSALNHQITAIRRFLSSSLHHHTPIPNHHLSQISLHLSHITQQTILNATTLLSSNLNPKPPEIPKPLEPPLEENCEIIEIDESQLTAEHAYFCHVCGKGFKRDANLRMHMRAHGNQYKTLQALTKPPDLNQTSSASGRTVKFSCPSVGCNRNVAHAKFRPMKSVICVRNHFKRSHYPKMYSCYRCNKKNFSVLADLRNHVKSCGESSRWRCSCGTTFSRKDKLFGHIALFEGHMPAVGGSENEVVLGNEEGKGTGAEIGDGELNVDGFSSRFFKDLVEEFDEIERSSWMSS